MSLAAVGHLGGDALGPGRRLPHEAHKPLPWPSPLLARVKRLVDVLLLSVLRPLLHPLLTAPRPPDLALRPWLLLRSRLPPRLRVVALHRLEVRRWLDTSTKSQHSSPPVLTLKEIKNTSLSNSLCRLQKVPCWSYRGKSLNAALSYNLNGLSRRRNWPSGSCSWKLGRHCMSGRSWCVSSGSRYGSGLNRGSSVANGFDCARNGGGLSHGYHLRGGGYSQTSGCYWGTLCAGSWYLRGSHGRNINCLGSTYCHQGSRSTRGSAYARRNGYACGLPCCIRWYAPLNSYSFYYWTGSGARTSNRAHSSFGRPSVPGFNQVWCNKSCGFYGSSN